MATSFIREPEGGVSGTEQRTVRVSAPIEDREAEYRAEIASLKADMARLAQTVSGTVRDSVKPMARELEAAVLRHPTASVAIAAGLGLVLGLLMTRK